MNKVLIALLTGVAIGILIAPAKGSVTRKKIVDGLNDVADELTDLKDRYIPSEEKRVWERAFGDRKMSSYV